MTDAMFELPSDPNTKSLEIDGDYAKEKFEKSKFKKLKVAKSLKSKTEKEFIYPKYSTKFWGLVEFKTM